MESGLDQNEQSFKGIFMRNCAYFLASLGNNAPASLKSFITQNADYVQRNAINQGKVNADWIGASQIYGAAPQGAGIDLFTAAARVTVQPGSQPWSYTLPIAGAGTSENPSACEFNGRLFALWKGVGNDDGIWFASMDQHNNWTGQSKIPNMGTSTSPAVAVFNSALYAAWKGGSDNNVWFAVMGTNSSWSGQTRFIIPGRTTRSPALATFGPRLYNLRAANRGSSVDDNNIFYSFIPYQGVVAF